MDFPGLLWRPCSHKLKGGSVLSEGEPWGPQGRAARQRTHCCHTWAGYKRDLRGTSRPLHLLPPASVLCSPPPGSLELPTVQRKTGTGAQAPGRRLLLDLDH